MVGHRVRTVGLEDAAVNGKVGTVKSAQDAEGYFSTAKNFTRLPLLAKKLLYDCVRVSCTSFVPAGGCKVDMRWMCHGSSR